MAYIRDPEKAEITHLLRFVNVDSKRVVEIGSGPGVMTWQYADRCAYVAGVEANADSLASARSSRPTDSRAQVDFFHNQAEDLPFPSGHFDVAIFTSSL